MAKTKNIQSTEELLSILSELGTFAPYPQLEWNFHLSSNHKASIRISIGSQQFEKRLYLVTQPSRRWLEQRNHDEVLYAPHIANELANDYRKAGLNHGDLNGRLFISEGASLIDIRPESTRYKTAHKGPDLFAPKPTRILRSFLAQQDHLFTQEKLTNLTDASRALVSQVLKQLVAEDYITQEVIGSRASPSEYRLKDFDALLQAWEQKDQWNKRVIVHQFSIFGAKPESLALDTLEALGRENVAFTQWIAAWLRRPHTTPPVVSAYIKNLNLLDTAASLGRPVKTGGNLWLIQPKDEGVFQNTQEVNGLPLVSDAQIYLDLIQASLRGPETARELRTWEHFSR